MIPLSFWALLVKMVEIIIIHLQAEPSPSSTFKATFFSTSSLHLDANCLTISITLAMKDDSIDLLHRLASAKVEIQRIDIRPVGRLSDICPAANHSGPELVDKKTFSFYCAVCRGTVLHPPVPLFKLLMNEMWTILLHWVDQDGKCHWQ